MTAVRATKASSAIAKAANDARDKEQRDAAMIEKRRELWRAINQFVHRQGGWLVSAPGDPWVRIEVREGSELPDRLADLGYGLTPIGSPGERIVGGQFIKTVCFRFQIPVPTR